MSSNFSNSSLTKTVSKITLVIFYFSSISSVVEAQIAELGLMQGLSQEIVRQQGQSSPLENEDQGDQPDSSDKMKKDQNLEDKDFGFTGGKNFNTSPRSKFNKQSLKYFGYDFFADAPTTFVSLQNVPVPQDYVIGPGDNVRVLLIGNRNKKLNLKVSREGDILFPEVGQIYVAGLTFSEMKKSIEEIIDSQVIGTKAIVTLGSLRSINIFILGDAFQPGMYTVSALSSLTNALISSGGISTTGSLRNIELKRKGKLVANFDFYDLLLKGDASSDVRLMSGDVIFIPPVSKMVGIEGEVNRPGIYELLKEESLSDLIQYAGKLKPKANPTYAELTRVNKVKNSFDLVSLNLNDSSVKQYQIQNGDVLSVFPVADNLKNAIAIKGHSQQPGFYSWRDGLRISDLFRSSDDLLDMTDLNYVLVKRKDSSSQRYEFHQTNLENIFKNKDSKDNLLLNDNDEIYLFPSMLSTDLIRTKLFYDNYELDKQTNELVLEDEWDSMIYLRKSLLEETLQVKEQNNVFEDQTKLTMKDSQENPDIDIRRYYEYMIYDYCTIPESLAVMVVENSGFRAKKSVPLEEVEKLNSPEEFIQLQLTIEKDRAKSSNNESKDEFIVKTITDLCRRQLIDPLLDIVKSDGSSSELGLVSIYGNVHFPGTYPYTNQMNLSNAINAAGGSKSGTYITEVEVISRTNIGKKFSNSSNFISMDDAEGFKLKEMDTLNIKQLSTSFDTVKVVGEVFFPGEYPISENQTLGELIARAGGITESGSVKAAYFQRESVMQAETQRLKSAQTELRRKIVLGSQSGGIGQNSLDNETLVQLTSLVTDNNNDLEALGRIVIDLEAIIREGRGDIILEDGDTINIPKKKQSVSVIGEVFVRNSHIYQDGRSLEEYISLSGGVTTYADVKNIYLIKSDGRIVSPSQLSGGFFRSSSSALEPGDSIVVPLKVQPFSGIKATTEITQIIYQMALAAAAVNSF